MKTTILIVSLAATVGACSAHGQQLEDQIIASVREAAGGAPELQFTRVAWCPKAVKGKRAAMVAAVGPVVAGSESGAGGYFVEVSDDGSLGPAVKASPPQQSPSNAALRIDRTYCEGRLVEAPYEAVRQLHDMAG